MLKKIHFPSLARRKKKDEFELPCGLNSESICASESKETTKPPKGSEDEKLKRKTKIPGFMKFHKLKSSKADNLPDVFELSDDLNSDSIGTAMAKKQTEKPPKGSADEKRVFKFPGLMKRHKFKSSTGDTLSDESELPGGLSSDFICAPVAEQQTTGPKRSSDDKRKCKIKIPGFIKHHKLKSPTADTLPEIPVIADFNKNLAEAGQQLLTWEERIFSSESDEQKVHTEAEEDRLQKAYENLLLHLRMVISDSFKKENQETLKNAVTAILQEEERDRRWEEAAEDERPTWRPLRCRQIHDTLLQKVVEVRIQRANEEESGVDKLSTSLKKDVCRMGKRIQNDLLQVVRDVQKCYTPEFDVCNMYTQLYHQAFSTKLQELARSNVTLEDCIYILSWINDYYPKDVLHQKDLETQIKYEALGPLLPAEALKPMEEQYLLHKEAEVRMWLSNALKKEEEDWQAGNKPEQMDGHYISNLVLDVIHLVDGAMKDAVTVLGTEVKPQRILLQLANFILSYKKSIYEFIKGKHKNITEILKAVLVSIKQLREYIESRENLPGDVKAVWLSNTAKLRDSCHKYLLSTTHRELKEHYRKLWTQAWFSQSHSIIGDLLTTLEDQMQHFKDLKPVCMEELWSQLHIEVMTEYVRRMLKRKLKLKDKDEQEAAAGFLCDDSIRINAFFVRNGSKETWLSSILPKVSEVLRVQDAEILQLEVVTLARTYPDISEHHILALLHLKTNLSSVDLRNIKDSLTENRNSSTSRLPPSFFCNVPVQKTVSCIHCLS